MFNQLTTMAVPVTGWVIASRRPANRIGWLILMAGAALAVSQFLTAYGLRAVVAAPGTLPAGLAAAWLGNWVWVGTYVAVAYVFLLFPTGRLRTPRWRSAGEERLQMKWFATAAVLVIITLILAALLPGMRYFGWLPDVAFFGLIVAVAVAVLKYRLYDIDVVISKAVQYGILAAFITRRLRGAGRRRGDAGR